MAKRNIREYKKYRQRKLKGTSLLLRIQVITGSTNLDNFNGSIKKLAIDCGYVPDEYTYMPVTESIKKKIKQFVYEYHQVIPLFLSRIWCFLLLCSQRQIRFPQFGTASRRG